MSVWERLRHFKPAEFGAGADHMDAGLLTRLDALREAAGVACVITSAFRDGDDLSHGRGFAVDIADNAHGAEVSSQWRLLVTAAAISSGFTRIGVYPKHVHVDTDPSLPQGVLWVSLDR